MTREAAMRLVTVACFTLMPTLVAAQTNAPVPSDPQAYCVNPSADFYPYTGELCKSGYQLGRGNCRKTDGSMATVPKEQCAAMGIYEVPFEVGIPPRPAPRTR